MLNKEKPVEVSIDREKCKKCGLCISLCPDYLMEKEGFPVVNNDSLFGCFQCGNCMMTCPTEAIKVRGEAINEDDVFPLNNDLPDFDKVNNLFLKRRSIRKFKDEQIPSEIINKIINAASTAPVGIPPSEVKVLVLNGKDKVQELAEELVKDMEVFYKKMNPFVFRLLKLFMSSEQRKMLEEFVLPFCKAIVDSRKKGVDDLFYNAPAIIIFYTSKTVGGVEDQSIAATFGTIAAESLGLGTCFIGVLAPLLEKNNKLKEQYGFLKNEKPGIAFILGYPDIKYLKGIKRKFKDVKIID